jgi:hypothetical protein
VHVNSTAPHKVKGLSQDEQKDAVKPPSNVNCYSMAVILEAMLTGDGEGETAGGYLIR